MSETIIIPHTAYKYNWRYAQLQVNYYAPTQSNSRVTGLYINWYASKAILQPVPSILSTVSGGEVAQLYGMTSTRPANVVDTTVNNNDDDKAKITSKIFGYYGRTGSAVAYHTLQFRIPIGQEATYRLIGWNGDYCWYTTDGYIECELLGEV